MGGEREREEACHLTLLASAELLVDDLHGILLALPTRKQFAYLADVQSLREEKQKE